jgi:hypothetical protein
MFLLSPDFPGVEELRLQARVAVVSEGWDDCCASVCLRVEDRAAPRSDGFGSGQISASSKARPARELLLLVRGGYLSSLEIVHYEEEPGPPAFPDPSDFAPPERDENVVGGHS